MSAAPLSRGGGTGRAAAPVRLVHLGLGSFFRAHQCWYTEHAPDAPDWGYAAFSGRSPTLAEALTAQDGLYTLVTRAAEGDRFEVISALSRAHAAADHGAWLDYFASPELAAVTLTVTEAGYLRAADGGLDRDHADVRADVAALRADADAPVRTAPARLVAGIAARRRADAGPLTLVPCDNLADNGAITARVVRELAEMVDPQLIGWIDGHLSVVTTTVDRITPRTTDDDRASVAGATGRDDRAPVATEPFHEWVLAGSGADGGFPAGRPRWEAAGATFTDDATPYEHRKLWLLNGAHSLLAYAASIRGHRTVAEAVADDTCRHWMQQWWDLATPHLSQPAADLAAYCEALSERFANPRIHHRLDQIAADGSQKLPVRILPVLRLERAAGRMPAAAVLVLAAWVCHLRGVGAAVTDARAEDFVARAVGPLSDAVRRVLDGLDPALDADADLVSAITAEAERLQRQAPR
ncbi:mannitol dehydrogenase family protein [Mycolicibacterium thermoresistibile]